MPEAPIISEQVRRKGRREVEKKFQTLARLKVEYMEIDSIKANSYNPNRQSEHDFELLLRSMGEDGFTQPIVCMRVTEETIKDKAFRGYSAGDIVIVDGEHRWRAAKKLGYPDIPVVVTSMTPEQMRISTLRHNRARGSEDLALAAEVLRDLETLGALDWAQDSLMLDDTEIQRLLEDFKAPDIHAAEEFSEAWIPDKLHGSGDQMVTHQVDADGSMVTMRSVKAIEELRKREKLIEAAKTEEERASAAKVGDIVRYFFMFTGDDASIVSRVLGKQNPAEKLVEICRNLLPPETETVQ